MKPMLKRAGPRGPVLKLRCPPVQLRDLYARQQPVYKQHTTCAQTVPLDAVEWAQLPELLRPALGEAGACAVMRVLHSSHRYTQQEHGPVVVPLAALTAILHAATSKLDLVGAYKVQEEYYRSRMITSCQEDPERVLGDSSWLGLPSPGCSDESIYCVARLSYQEGLARLALALKLRLARLAVYGSHKSDREILLAGNCTDETTQFFVDTLQDKTVYNKIKPYIKGLLPCLGDTPLRYLALDGRCLLEGSLHAKGIEQHQPLAHKINAAQQRGIISPLAATLMHRLRSLTNAGCHESSVREMGPDRAYQIRKGFHELLAMCPGLVREPWRSSCRQSRVMIAHLELP